MLSTTARRGTSPGRGVSLGAGVASLFALVGLAIGLRPLTDNSLFTHIATGRLILDSGIPRADPYSYTANGTPWVVQSWLPSLVYGLLDRIADGTGIRVLAGVATAGLALVVWRLTRPARTLLPRIGVALLPVVVGSTFWVPRPLLFGLLAMGAVLVWAEERYRSWWFVPLFWLWANSHGSFPLGLVLIGTVLVGRRLDGEAVGEELRALGWAVLGTVLAVIGPLGLDVLAFPVTLLGRREILQNVQEWKPPAWDQTWARVFLLQVVVAVIALVRHRTWARLLPMVLFTATALLATRNVPVASLVLVPGTAAGFAGLGRLRTSDRTPLGAAMVAVAVLVGAFQAVTTLSAPAYDLQTYPATAFTWLDQRGVLDGGTHVLTQDTNSNLVELLWGGRVGVFVDDRYDMFPMPVLRDYLVLHRAQDGWDGILDRNGIDVVVWDKTAPLAERLAADPDWSVAFQDGTWLVACRRGSAAGDRCAAS